MSYAVLGIRLVGFPGVRVPKIAHWEIAWIPPRGGPLNPSGYGWPPRRVSGISNDVRRVVPVDGYYTWRIAAVAGHHTYRDLALALDVWWPPGAKEFGYQAVVVSFRGQDQAIHTEMFGDGYLVCAPTAGLSVTESRAACDARFSRITEGF
ncbi:MAG TPA: hypothetical protein VGS61_02630 [Acidimicrobiales bacterium]|nr:hypothetical protein [Acidimicrobiales bacterium]